MIDIKMLRTNFEKVCKSIRSRCKPYEQLDEFEKIDTEFRKVTTKIQDLNAERNKKSKEISNMVADKAKNENEIKAIQKDVKKLKTQIDELEIKAKELEVQLKDILLSIPNIPDASVVLGEDETKNKEMHR